MKLFFFFFSLCNLYFIKNFSLGNCWLLAGRTHACPRVLQQHIKCNITLINGTTDILLYKENNCKIHVCCLGKWDSDLAKCHIPNSAILKEIQFVHFTSTTENTDRAKVMYSCSHHLSPEFIMWKEWDTMPKRNIPLKLIRKILKILIKRIYKGRPVSIDPNQRLCANHKSSHDHCSFENLPMSPSVFYPEEAWKRLSR